MRAIDIIEAEDPKRFMLDRKAQMFKQLRRELEPQGWATDQNGHLFKELEIKVKGAGPFRHRKYELFVNAGNYLTPRTRAEQPPFVLRITNYYYYNSTGQKERIDHEDLRLGSIDSVRRHLRMFNLAEAESPRNALKRANAIRYIKGGREIDIVDGTGSVIRYTLEYGPIPVIGYIQYGKSVPEEAWETVGMRLLNAAYDYARKQREYRVKVSIYTTRYADPRGSRVSWDVPPDHPGEIAQLVHKAKEGVTSASGMVRSITLENVLSLEPGGGGLRLDTRPKAPRSIWTHRRKDPQGKPEPYRRVRQLPNGKELVMYVAYRKDHAPTKLMALAKEYTPEVAKMAGWAASDIAHALSGEAVTLVMPVPSAKPLAKRLARLIARRLGVPHEEHLSKSGPVSHLPISVRKAVAPSRFSVTGKFRGQTVLVVDDYIVTGASQMAVAAHLYKAGAKKVVGAALAI